MIVIILILLINCLVIKVIIIKRIKNKKENIPRKVTIVKINLLHPEIKIRHLSIITSVNLLIIHHLHKIHHQHKMSSVQYVS
jgi:hypothetical protein